MKKKLTKPKKSDIIKKTKLKSAPYRVTGCFDYIDNGVSTTQVIARLREFLKKAGFPDKNFEIEANRNLVKQEG